MCYIMKNESLQNKSNYFVACKCYRCIFFNRKYLQNSSTHSLTTHISSYIYIYIYIYITYIYYVNIICNICVKNISSYLRTTWLFKYVGYLCRILICEKMFKYFHFFMLILKFNFNSIWIFYFSCCYKKVSMYTTKCTKNCGKCTITCNTLEKGSLNSGGRKLLWKNWIRKGRKPWGLKIYVVFWRLSCSAITYLCSLHFRILLVKFSFHLLIITVLFTFSFKKCTFQKGRPLKRNC